MDDRAATVVEDQMTAESGGHTHRARPARLIFGDTDPAREGAYAHRPGRLVLPSPPLRTEMADTKSRAGRRAIGLPDELVALLRKHREVQELERQAARQLWRDGGWVFATPTGQPVNPRTDYTEWKRLLKAAQLRDGRLHDARHTAATVLLILGVPERAVMGIMGWSDSGMARRYQHLTAQIRRDIAKQVGGLLWEAGSAPPDDRDDGASGVLAPVA